MNRKIASILLMSFAAASSCSRQPAEAPASTEPPAAEITSAESISPAAPDDPMPPEQPRETVPPTDESPDTAAVAGEITLQPMPWESVQELIAARQGKVVVVDLWATYCAPCREEFPGLVELSKRDPGNIECVSVSLDAPEDQEKALEFLKEQRASTLTNVLCTTDPELLYDQILQIGGIPAVYVYGRDGQLAKVFNGPTPEGTEHTYAQHIVPFVVALAEGAEQPDGKSGE